MKKLLLIALLIVGAFAEQKNLSKIKFDHTTGQILSDKNIIQILDTNSYFVNDVDFIIYKKITNRLRYSKYFYAFGLSNLYQESIASNPELDNIMLSIIIPNTFYLYNKSKQKNKLDILIKKYNSIYYNIEQTKNILQSNRGSISLGLFNEKIPINNTNLSIIRTLSKKSEFYGTIGTFAIAMGMGIGGGYKYYLISNNISSPFINISLNASMGPLSLSNGINLSAGQSIKLFKHGNLYVNIGIVSSYTNLDLADLANNNTYKLVMIPFIYFKYKLPNSTS